MQWPGNMRIGFWVGASWTSLLAGLVSACASGRLPAITPPQVADGPLALRVAYPPTTPRGALIADGGAIRADSVYAIQSRDSTFIFGSLGRGDASLAINGHEISVYPSGAWIAWLPLPDDSVARFTIVATVAGDTVRGVLDAPIAGWQSTPTTAAWVDTTSLFPRGDLWVRAGERYRLSVRASPGAHVRAFLPAGDTVRFLSDSAATSPVWGEEAFGTVAPLEAVAQTDRFVAWRTGGFGPGPGGVLAPLESPAPDDSGWVRVEAVLGADTARARWPLRIGEIGTAPPPAVMVDDDPADTGETDGVLPGRPVPFGTYHWFFPNGTVAAVSGRRNAQIRLQLSRTSSAWVDAAGVRPMAAGAAPPGGSARSIRLLPSDSSVTLRVPLSGRVPFRVRETERAVILRLYGVAADMDWIQYGTTDSFVRAVSFRHPTEDEVEITVELDEPVWGYRTAWSEGNLLLEIRRPPRIHRQPFRGRRIAVDAGHPPGGATGPSGVTEAEVTLAVSRLVRDLLERRGAEVVMTRDSDAPVGLVARTALAERTNAELLVSIHANALPDGVNPHANSGTSVYYNHPRSIELARMVDRALVRRLGFRDLGIGRGDLHMARPTWMPAVLTEGLFMMIPEQEAVLVSERGQLRYAEAVVEGIGEFLRWRRGQSSN